MIDWAHRQTRERFREAIQSMTECYPERAIIDSYLDSDCNKLQDFCANWSEYDWMTGLGVIEAAQLLVEGAIENGNIDEEGHIK